MFKLARFAKQVEKDEPSTPPPKDLREAIVAALRKVMDPEIPLNLYDLGLIYRLEIDAKGQVDIDMTLTAPACPVAGAMPGMVENAVRTVAGVTEVNVALVWEPRWNKDRISEAGKLQLGLL
ncbi:MAG: DUF59 domain-containing protein [bacterium]